MTILSYIINVGMKTQIYLYGNKSITLGNNNDIFPQNKIEWVTGGKKNGENISLTVFQKS